MPLMFQKSTLLILLLLLSMENMCMNLNKFDQTRAKPSDKVIPENTKGIMQQDLGHSINNHKAHSINSHKAEKRNSIRNITDIA